MSFEIIAKNQVTREITLNIPGADVNKIADEMVSDARRKANIPGFRKGKVPASIIRQRMGDAIDQDARSSAARQAAAEAVKDIENVIFTGEIQIAEMRTEDGGMVAKIEVEIAPTIEVSNYKGLEVEVTEAAVTDKMVEDKIEEMRKNSAVLEPVEDRKNVEEGDSVTVEFSNVSEAAEDLAHDGNRMIHVGDGDLNADWEKALIGQEVDSTVHLHAVINDKDADADAKIIEIKRRSLPKLDDDFARDQDAENLDELREKTRKMLEESESHRRDSDIDDALLLKLREAHATDIPENYVRERAAYAIKLQFEQMLRQRLNDNMIDYLRQNIREEELNEYRADYHNEVILNAVAAAENIEVSREDVLAEVKEWLPDMNDQQLEQWLRSQQSYKFTEEQVKRDKALKLIKESAKITDKPRSAE